jgi:hypothetical protein
MPDAIDWPAAFGAALTALGPFVLQLLTFAMAYQFTRVAVEDHRRPVRRIITWAIGVIAVIGLIGVGSYSVRKPTK